MKKILLVLCVLFCSFGCSCKKEKDIKVKIDYEDIPQASDSSSYLYGKYSLLSYELDYSSEYDEKINNKDSFLLFIYRDGCFGCELLSKSLKTYMDENPIAIYTISLNNLWEHDLYKTENINDTPYLILIEEGKIVYKELIGSNSLTGSDKAKNDEFVKSWIEKHIIWEE